MNTRKLCGTVAAAIFTFALSGAASAEDYFQCPTTADIPVGSTLTLRDMTIDRLIEMRDDLLCVDSDPSSDTFSWDGTNGPIWQHKKSALKGCTVHTKLAKLLYEKRPVTSTKPKINKNGTNDAKGAAHDLMEDTDVKDDSAIAQLNLLIQYIGDAVENQGMEQYATDFATDAGDAAACIAGL